MCVLKIPVWFCNVTDRVREEDTEGWREGKGRTNVTLLLLDARWIRCLFDSGRIAADSGPLFFPPLFFFLNDPSSVSVSQLTQNNGLRHQGDNRGIHGECVGAMGMSSIICRFEFEGEKKKKVMTSGEKDGETFKKRVGGWLV